METEKVKRILTAPDSKPYPEKLENLLTIEKAAEIWKTPAVTIRAKCKAGFFGHYARKMGGQWILTPEAMFIWKGAAQGFCDIGNERYGIQTWENFLKAARHAAKHPPEKVTREYYAIQDLAEWTDPDNPNR